MADDTSRSTSDHPGDHGGDHGGGRDSSRGPGRGPREGREPGGFRIRLSDNEMQGARALQEAFGLRSTVAVLGFALRTLAQQLEAGQLDELVAQQRAQGGFRGPAPRRERDGERRAGRDEGRGGGSRGDAPQGGARVNPFARPSRPAAPTPAPTESEAGEAPEASAPADQDVLTSETEAATSVEPVAGADLAASDDASGAAAAEAAPEADPSSDDA